jgi:hypothetical protein
MVVHKDALAGAGLQNARSVIGAYVPRPRRDARAAALCAPSHVARAL